MDANCSLQSKYLPYPKLGNLFIKKSAATTLPSGSKFDLLASRTLRRTSRELVTHQRDSASTEARLSSLTSTSASYTDNEEDGIYETLDRHWTFKTEQNEKNCFQTGDVKLIVQHQEGSGCCDNVVESLRKQNNFAAPYPKNLSTLFNCQLGTTLNDTCQIFHTTFSSSEAKDNRKIVCQISMFEITDTHETPALIETSYYHVQPQIQVSPGNKSETIPDVFSSSSLRIVQDGSNDKHAERDLFLKPLKEEGIRQKLQDPQPEGPEKTANTYEKPYKSESKRFPSLLVKKSESFRDASTTMHAAKQQHRSRRRKSDCSDRERPVISQRASGKQANISTGPEATRILTKLGPLPPLPIPNQDSLKKATKMFTTEKCSLDEAESKANGSSNCQRSLKPTSSGSFLSPSENHLVPTHSLDVNNAGFSFPETADPASSRSFSVTSKNKREELSAQLEISTDAGPELSKAVENGHLEISTSSFDIDKLMQNTRTISADSASAQSNRNARSSARSSGGSQVTNHYFVLEPRERSSSSCSSSDNDELSDGEMAECLQQNGTL